MFLRQYACKKAENPYFCIVFFIVLDLRLTRLGYGGIPFFMPKSLEKGKHTCHNHPKTRCTCTMFHDGDFLRLFRKV